MAAGTATIPPEREGEFLAAFRELSQADKPEGLQRSELLRAKDGRWVIQSLWRDREAIAEARQGGRKPAALALLDSLGATHTHELFTVEHATPGGDGLDLAGLREAITAKDADAWISFYAKDAVWTEYRHADPPRAPHVMRGLEEIGAFVHGVCAAPISISLSRELSGEHLSAFMLTVDVGDGRRIIENVSVEHVDGKIVTQVDVEAWD